MAWCLVSVVSPEVRGAAGLGQEESPVGGVPGFPLEGLDGFAGKKDEVKVSARILVDHQKQEGILQIRADMADGWHIYSLTQKKPLLATKFKATDGKELKPEKFEIVGKFFPDGKLEIEESDLYDVPLEYYSHQVIWSARIKLKAGAVPEELKLTGYVDGQVCNDAAGCVPVGKKNGAFTASFVEYIDIAPYIKAMEQRKEKSEEKTEEKKKQSAAVPFSFMDMAWYGFSGFLGGLLLNLMPCVLPVIGLKVMSFAQQAGESRQRIILLNICFVVGILLVFMILAGLAAFAGWAWGAQFQRPGYAIGLALVVFVFALSFLGVWEVPIPGFVGAGSAAKAAEKEGPVGAVAKGILTTLLATPCGAPFVAPTLTWAASQNYFVVFATFASMGLGMGSPYLALGAFPRLLKALPKPGAWMETFKQIMGFVLLGTVVWILFLLYQIRPDYLLPTVATMFASWAGCWWIGRIGITASSSKKFVHYAGALAMTLGLSLISFTILMPQVEKWGEYSPAALAKLRDEGRPVFVDFTAAWCLSCKFNERAALRREETERYIESNGITVLIADKTTESPEIEALLDELGNTSGTIPYYAIYPPGGGEPVVFNDIPLTPTKLLDYFEQALGGAAGAMVETRTAAEAETHMQ
jgi:thiol:disulfide interchange protein DsbD